jgi:hypothetical protein
VRYGTQTQSFHCDNFWVGFSTIRESIQITQELKSDNLERIVIGAGSISKGLDNREAIKEMRACRSSRWHNRSEISAPTGACFFVFEDSNLTELTCVATQSIDVLQLHVSVLSLGLEPDCFPVDLADANLDLHLLQAGLVEEVIAACSDPPAMAPDAIQQHETPATVCWIVTKKIKTSFIHALCIRRG